MGARFDKWLARPSTLHFLRQLIGPEHAATTSTRPRPRLAVPRRNAKRNYASASAPGLKPTGNGSGERTFNAQSIAAIETYHEQRRRVAKEFRLRIPEYEDEGRSAHYGSISPAWTSYSDLIYAEARVRDDSSTRGLLIDHPDNRGNLKAWCRILQYRERTDGFNGVLDVWKGMRKRGINLPVDGECADAFWTTFLHHAIVQKIDEVHQQLVREIYAHAEDLKSLGLGHYRPFHKILIGRFLREAPGSGRQLGPEYDWHIRSRENGLCSAKGLGELMLDVLQSSRPYLAARRFRKMYLDDREYNLYDSCMPIVLSAASDDLATIMQWHNFFVSKNDMPSSDLANTTPVNNLLHMAGAHDRESFPSRDERKELSYTLAGNQAANAKANILELSRASMNSLVGDVHGIKPKAVSDEFCARMFATRAFSLETVIRGIALLGIEALGPVALRELAIRAASPHVLMARLADIKDSGMELVPSIYVRLLEKTATGSNADLFQALLNSDQHPENYDDKHMQETLLSKFLDSDDFAQIHLTVLALSSADHEMAVRAWNRVFQHHVKAQNYPEILRIYNEIGAHQLRLSRRSLNFMVEYLLPERPRSKLPNYRSKSGVGRVVPIEFVINAHMYAVEHGSEIFPRRWIELLKRCGMTGSMETLARFALWLAANYSQPREKDLYARLISKSHLRLKPWLAQRNSIFSGPMIRALVIWGFRDAAARDELRPSPSSRNEEAVEFPDLSTFASAGDNTETWAQGIVLLLQLRRLGVPVTAAQVRRGVEETLWPVFGPGISDLAINMRSILRNKLGLAHYVKHANEVWDVPVFEISEELLSEGDPQTEAKLLPAVFGNQRLVDQKEGTWVDVEAWASALADGTWQDTPTTTHEAREESWEVFPFKIFDDLTNKERFTSGKHHPRRVTPERPLTELPHPSLADEKLDDAEASEESLTPPRRPPPAAQTLNSHLPPNLPNIPEDF